MKSEAMCLMESKKNGNIKLCLLVTGVLTILVYNTL